MNYGAPSGSKHGPLGGQLVSRCGQHQRRKKTIELNVTSTRRWGDEDYELVRTVLEAFCYQQSKTAAGNGTVRAGRFHMVAGSGFDRRKATACSVYSD